MLLSIMFGHLRRQTIIQNKRAILNKDNRALLAQNNKTFPDLPTNDLLDETKSVTRLQVTCVSVCKNRGESNMLADSPTGASLKQKV